MPIAPNSRTKIITAVLLRLNQLSWIFAWVRLGRDEDTERFLAELAAGFLLVVAMAFFLIFFNLLCL
jgi:hypothetical protein